MVETTGLGAAYAAGSAVGVEVWDVKNLGDATFDKFLPSLIDNEIDVKHERWKKALNTALEWPETDLESARVSKSNTQLMSSIPISIFAFSTFLLLKLAASMASSSK